MQLQHLKYFLQIAETGSMNKAADQLFVSQPSLSKVISCMEAELNIKIFERNNRGVSLTEDGKKLYMYTKNILNQFDLISKISTEEIPSVISVSAYPNLLSTSLLSQYYSLYQGKNIIFTLRESRINQIAEDVSGLRSEIGVLHINNAQSKEVYRLLDYHNLEFHLVATDTWYAVVGPNNPLFHSSCLLYTSRFAPYIQKVFPETSKSEGIIESELREIPEMKKNLNIKWNAGISGKLLLKMDSHLPISGSVKARGGIYEILKYAEQLALLAGLLSPGEDYSKLAGPEFRKFFGQYKIQVGSTGNLGLSIGIISAKLGFQVIVHMSADARQWLSLIHI